MIRRVDMLPKILRHQDGSQVLTQEDWQNSRRQEILELFRENVYGKEPLQRPEQLTFKVKSEDQMMDGEAIRKTIEIQFKGPGGIGSIHPTIFIPAKAKKPVPVFLFINHRQSEFAEANRSRKSDYWPAERIIERGFGAAVFQTDDVDPDHYDGFQNGVHKIFDPPGKKRPANAWGTIAAWAWGASRVMDYFEQDADIDAQQIILVGHSRGGKTALWAGALDERFAMIVSNNSGCTGAAISRGKKGENLRIINTAFPHWFCENYKAFNDRESELPIDQHMLLALIAPRKLYVASASEDEWADPDSEFLSLLLAEEVYKLYGFSGLGSAESPPVNTPVFGDHLGYHVREGIHKPTRYDWECFMDFYEA